MHSDFPEARTTRTHARTHFRTRTHAGEESRSHARRPRRLLPCSPAAAPLLLLLLLLRLTHRCQSLHSSLARQLSLSGCPPSSRTHFQSLLSSPLYPRSPLDGLLATLARYSALFSLSPRSRFSSQHASQEGFRCQPQRRGQRLHRRRPHKWRNTGRRRRRKGAEEDHPAGQEHRVEPRILQPRPQGPANRRRVKGDGPHQLQPGHRHLRAGQGHRQEARSARRLGVRRPVGRHCHDGLLPAPHVLPLDLPLVLRWPDHRPKVHRPDRTLLCQARKPHLRGRLPHQARLCRIRRSHGLPVRLGRHHARLLAGGPARPLAQLQDPPVQVQRPGLLLRHPRHMRSAPPLGRIPPHDHHRPLWRVHDRGHDHGLRRLLCHLLPRRVDQDDPQDVRQLRLRPLDGSLPQPAHRHRRPQDVARGPHPMDPPLHHLRLRRLQAVRVLRLRHAQHGLHGPRHWPLYQRLRKGRGVHPADLGHLPREVGLHGHLLELCRRALYLLLLHRVHGRPPAPLLQVLHADLRLPLLAPHLCPLRLRLEHGPEVPLQDAEAGKPQGPLVLPAVALVHPREPSLPADGARQRSPHRRMVAVCQEDQLHGRLDAVLPLGRHRRPHLAHPVLLPPLLPRRPDTPLHARL